VRSGSHHATDVGDRRAGRPHSSMFLRMLVRAAVQQRGRAGSALLATVVAAAVATAMLTLYTDVQAKLRTEFRRYGANVVVVGREGAALPPDALSHVESALGTRGIAVPFAYIVARTDDGRSVVVAGTDLDRVRRLNQWWSVTAWPASAHDALIGVRAAAVVTPANAPFNLRFGGQTVQVTPAGTLQTGAAEDSRVYLSMQDLQSWTGVRPSAIEIAVTGSSSDVDALIQRLARALPTAEVRPVRQIVEAETRVLGKTRSALLASTVVIMVTSALCVLATLVGWVFDRRRDFAIMKALGASDRLLSAFFAAEAAAVGALGALVGFVIGVGIAAWIGRVNFHAAVAPRFSVLPLVLAGCVAMALLSAALPIGLLRRVHPGILLRGD
jgi:putative ABC transport system permease protein